MVERLKASGCDGCYFKRNQFVGPRGNPKAPIVFVGESPGTTELVKGLPFVGPSGKVLTDCFPESLTEDDYYITNALQCAPRKGPDDDKNKTELQRGTHHCRSRLLAEINAHPRKLIVALGNGALWALTGNTSYKITKERGKLFPSELAERGILASVHPAYLLRGGGSYKKFKSDIQYALDLVEGLPEKKPIVPTWSVAETEQHVKDFIDYTLECCADLNDWVIGADVETGGFNHLHDEILCLGWSIDPREVFIVPESLLETQVLKYRDFDKSALYGGPLKWCWQNGKFDVKFMRMYGFDAGVDHDTMLMSYCLTPKSRVLKTDMSWIAVENLSIGDEVVGFDELAKTKRINTPGSNFKPAKILGLKRQQAPIYKITTPFGSVECSGNHRWAVRRYKQRFRQWVKTKVLFESLGAAELSLFFEPYEHCLTDHEVAYMSGILDGEGHASYTAQNTFWQVGFSQNAGVVLDKCLAILNKANISYTIATRVNHPTIQIRFEGGRSQLKALSIFKPIRLLGKLPKMWQGKRKCLQAEILSIEYVGVGTVIGIETSTQTLIAEGYMSHNSMEERAGFHDLEQIASDEIGAPNYKAMLKPYLPNKKTSYRVVPKPVLHKYLASDVSNTKQIAIRLHKRICEDEKNSKLYHKVLIPASELLADVEHNGMLVDFAKVKENTSYYLTIVQEHHETLNAIALELNPSASYKRAHSKEIFIGINPSSPAQVSKLLYDQLKLSNRKRGTGKEILEKLPSHPAVTALLAHRKAAKAYGTYVKSLHMQVFDDGRVHSTYLIHGTATGRLSSREPNLQNQPRGSRIRGQFIAAKGKILAEFDLDQAELRCLAALSKDKELCRIYEGNNLSLHKEVSATLWGDTWKERYALDDPEDPIWINAYEEYMRTKALNFGIIYGREAASIAAEFEVSIREAQNWINMWAERFPGAWDFIQKCRMSPIRGQNLTTPFGRRKRVGVVSREKLRELQNEAANFPHQSIASDITLVSAIKVRPQLKLWGVDIVNLIHDAILVEMPDNDALFLKTAKFVTSEMEKTPVEWGINRIPFKADAKTGIRWGDLKNRKF